MVTKKAVYDPSPLIKMKLNSLEKIDSVNNTIANKKNKCIDFEKRLPDKTKLTNEKIARIIKKG